MPPRNPRPLSESCRIFPLLALGRRNGGFAFLENVSLNVSDNKLKLGLLPMYFRIAFWFFGVDDNLASRGSHANNDELARLPPPQERRYLRGRCSFLAIPFLRPFAFYSE